jgi:hypothetical protein
MRLDNKAVSAPVFYFDIGYTFRITGISVEYSMPEPFNIVRYLKPNPFGYANYIPASACRQHARTAIQNILEK